MNWLIGFLVIACAVYLTPSKWKHRDKCANCGRYYTFYCRKNNRCSCFKKNLHGAVCGLVYVGEHGP